ncbi:helix-turn-helix domain-containing protein [Streptomyces flavofungini]|uniref:helix-turn-helix domain-containing protein n=1 Tax=Streptomyces flavofungini TaxID=68200 RepID=UPI0034DEE0EF
MDHRMALRQLLRWKREQLNPTSLGLPAPSGRGRRAPGLSQARVAQLLEVSERTYAQLERGDMASPSTDFLDRVALVLRLNERERIALYVYSLGHEPPHSQDPMAGRNVPAAWREAIVRVKGQPCYITDVDWNLVAYNDDFVRMFPRAQNAQPAVPEQNIMRYMLLTESAREHHMVNWEAEWLIPLAAQLRNAVARYPKSVELQRLDEEADADPVVGPVYRENTLAQIHPNGDVRKLRYTFSGAVDTDQHVHLDRCCERHARSEIGDLTMCAAMPLGSPGARFLMLVFKPDCTCPAPRTG